MDINVALTVSSGFHINTAFTTHADTRILGLTGPSGAGKSTLLKVLANLHPADVCKVDWGRKVSRIGLVFQDALLFPHLTVSENLGLAEQYAQSAPPRDNIIDGCECRHLLDRDVQSLSGGERQRVALARALINAPDVLLTDEAFSAMDNALAMQVQYFVKAHCQTHGIVLIMVSHDVKSLALLCDEVAVMQQGIVVASGSPETVLFHQAGSDPLYTVPFALIQGQISQEHIAQEQVTQEKVTQEKVTQGQTTQEKPEHKKVTPEQVGQDKPNLKETPQAQPDNMGASAGLYVIYCEGQRLYCRQPLIENGIGKITVDAQDVSIDLSHHHQSSILNAFECEICALEVVNESQALLTLERGSTTLYALISTLSVERLRLTIGMTVTARFKLR